MVHEKMLNIAWIIRQMQIITTMSYCLTPVKIAVIKKYTNDKCLRVYGERKLLYAIGENAQVENSIGIPKNKNKTITIISSKQSASMYISKVNENRVSTWQLQSANSTPLFKPCLKNFYHKASSH